MPETTPTPHAILTNTLAAHPFKWDWTRGMYLCGTDCAQYRTPRDVAEEAHRRHQAAALEAALVEAEVL